MQRAGRGVQPPRRDLQPSDNGSPWPKARAVHLDAEQDVEPALAVEHIARLTVQIQQLCIGWGGPMFDQVLRLP